MSEPALRAPDYIKIAASLISEYGWCGSNADPIGNDKPLGLDLSRAATWAVGGEHCLSRDLTPDQADHVAEVMDHFEAPKGFGVPVVQAEKNLAGVSAANVSLELLLMAVRYELSLVDVA